MDFLEINISQLTLIILIFFVGGTVKGIIGIGMPLIILVSTSFFLDIKIAIPLLLFSILVANLIQMLEGEHLLSIFNKTKIYFFISLFGIYPGFLVLRYLDTKYIIIVLGSLIVLNSVLNLFKIVLRTDNHRNFVFQSSFGLMNGFLGGLTGIYIMPLIFFIQSLRFNKTSIIQMTAMFFFSFGIIQILLFASHGMITHKVFLFSCVLCIPVLLGLFFGRFLRKYLNEQSFKRYFNAVLLLMGMVTVVQTMLNFRI